jgi:hypothetical protein
MHSVCAISPPMPRRFLCSGPSRRRPAWPRLAATSTACSRLVVHVWTRLGRRVSCETARDSRDEVCVARLLRDSYVNLTNHRENNN